MIRSCARPRHRASVSGQRTHGRPRPHHLAGTALVTHLHWDHVQGIPFFVPLLRRTRTFASSGPSMGSDLKSEISSFIRPPLFPCRPVDPPREIEFIEMSSGRIDIGSSTVTVASIEHVGPTNGYHRQRRRLGGVHPRSPAARRWLARRPGASVVEFCRVPTC
ncbi:MAG: hypothetical protein R2710_11820 [Acidimicrobiales bacterium]